ncbi:MAG: dTMP kinase [Pseudomonadota bacterium]
MSILPDKIRSKGLFLTLEGGEGSGKSTQIALLKERLEQDGYSVTATREPGGTPGAEAIRNVILSGEAEELGPEFEASLFAAARIDHVQNLILPNLLDGKIVLCDRFIDSTRVYQGVTGDVEMKTLYAMEKLIENSAWPDKTLILDIDPEVGMARAAERRNKNAIPDRFEKEGLDVQVARRNAFLDIANNEPERCSVIDASGSASQVHRNIWEAVAPVIAELGEQTDGR